MKENPIEMNPRLLFENASDREFDAALSVLALESGINLWLDSGASKHFTGDPSMLNHLSETTTSVPVQTAAGQSHVIQGKRKP